MPSWKFDRAPGAAWRSLFGGELTVVREGGKLRARWTGGGIETSTNLAHIGRFALRTSALQDLSHTQMREILTAKWLGHHRSWVETDETDAFELELHGKATMLDGGGVNIEVPGAACWIAPEAVRVHLKQAYPAYFAPYDDEPWPEIVIADEDPI